MYQQGILYVHHVSVDRAACIYSVGLNTLPRGSNGMQWQNDLIFATLVHHNELHTLLTLGFTTAGFSETKRHALKRSDFFDHLQMTPNWAYMMPYM